MKKLLNYDHEYYRWKDNIKLIENEVNQKKQVVSALSNNIKELFDQLLINLEKQRNTNLLTENSVDNSNNKLNDILKNISDLSLDLKMLEEKKENIDLSNQSLEVDLKEKTGEIFKLRDKISDLQKKYKYWSEYEEKFSHLERRFFERLELLKKEAANFTDNFSECLSSAENMENSWQRINNYLNLFIEKTQDKITQKDKELNLVKSLYSAELEKLNQIREQYLSVFYKVEGLRNEEKILNKYLNLVPDDKIKAAFNVSLDELKKEALTLRNEVIRNKSLIDDQKRIIIENEQVQKKLDETITDLNSNNKILLKEHGNAKEEYDDIETKLELNRNHLEKIYDMIDEKKTELEKLQSDYDSLKLQKDELDKEIGFKKKQPDGTGSLNVNDFPHDFSF